jgi:protein-L-isoaspartate(D-aspartate) O-methyltransferase
MINSFFGASSGSERKFNKRRRQLVEQLRERGIGDENVLQAIGNVPRHKFVETALEDRAYKDTALPIEKGQTISQPYTVAYQTQLLEVKKGDKVLEIGTGSGYQAAVLCEMGAQVYSVERVKHLYNRSRDILEELGYRAELKYGDGTVGWSAYAPYNAIIVTAAAPEVPNQLKQQLAVGGRLVVPVGDSGRQIMMRVTRTDEQRYETERFNAFKFVPLIGKEGWKE